MTPKPKTGPCGNEECDKCYPLPRWKVSQHRIEHVTHVREIKAASQKEALAMFARGSGPGAYLNDRSGEIVQLDEPIVERNTDPDSLRFHATWHCYHRLPK